VPSPDTRAEALVALGWQVLRDIEQRGDVVTSADLQNARIPRNLSNAQIERATLGVLLQWPERLSEIPTLLAAHFSTIEFRKTFAAIKTLHENGHSVDMPLVYNELKDDRDIAAVGEAGFISSSTNDAYHKADIKSYAERIIDYSDKRQLVGRMQETLERIGNGETLAELQVNLAKTLDLNSNRPASSERKLVVVRLSDCPIKPARQTGS
jgi:replicative DNA helicase